MAESSKPSWRRGSGPAAHSAGAGGAKGWQQKRKKASQSAASNHRAKLIGLGLVVIALATYFAVKVFFLHVKTPLLVLAVAHYPAPLPVNAYSEEDAARLGQSNVENLHVLRANVAEWSRDELLRQFDRLPEKGGGPDKNVVLIYLSAHGALNDSAQPCLIMPDSSPIDASTWLPWQEILDRVQKRPALQFVMLLDCGRVDEDWTLGILQNGFVDRLAKQFAEAPPKNLHVLCSVSAGERSWTAPELGGSVFAHYVANGLGDAASKNDDVITLRELEQYLKGQVRGWVVQNRVSTQTPRLLTPLADGQDLPVAYRGPGPKDSSADDQQRIAADWTAVNGLWDALETQILEQRLLRYEPIAVARLQQLLLRMEQLLLAGSGYRGDFNAAQTEFRTLLAEAQPNQRLPGDLQAFSFPLVKQLSNVRAADPNYQVLLQKWNQAKGKPQVAEGEPPLPKLDRELSRELAWSFLRGQTPPTSSQLQAALGLIDESASAAKRSVGVAEPAEILFLRMANAYVDRASGGEFTEGTQRYFQELLKAREIAEEAAAPEDVRTHLWLQSAVDAADVRRRLAEDALFCDGVAASSVAEVERLVSARFAFAADYERAKQQAQRMTAAYALRDEIFAGIPHLAAWLLQSDPRLRKQILGGDGTTAEAEVFLHDLAAKNHQLAAALDDALTAGNTEFPELDSTVKELRAAWRKLVDPFVEHCQYLKDRAGHNKQSLRDLLAALRVPSPWLEARERQRLAVKVQDILFAGAADGSARSADDEQPAEETKSGGMTSHPLAAILARDRLPLLLNIRSPESAAGNAQLEPLERFAKQSTQIRRWLTDLRQAASDLEDVTNRRLEEAKESAANLRAGISEADRLVRSAASIVATPVPDPAHRLRRVDLHLEFLWHARRALDDFWGPLPGSSPGSPSYFATVASAYLQGARRLENKHQSLIHGRANLQQLLGDRTAAIEGTRLEPQDVTSLGDTAAAEQQIHIDWHAALPSPGVAALFLSDRSGNETATLISVLDRDSRPWRRQLLELGKSPAADIVHRIPAANLAGLSSEHELSANLLYRGHLLRRPFSVRSSQPVLVNVSPKQPRNAKIVVRGEGNRRAFIVFVFDCSRSMEQSGRITLAKEAFRQVLDSLPRDEHYHVGLRAYGRRAGYGRNINEVFGPDGQPTTRDPNSDVEVLVDVDRFNDEQHAAITRRFRDLQPLGVTPLYLAIQQTLTGDDFNAADREDIKQIIVISDGVNEQPAGRNTTADDLIRTIQNDPKAQDVRVDVVLFQEDSLRRDPGLLERLSARGTTLPKELADVKAVARATGGDYFSAEQPDELAEVLRRSLKLVKFSVTAASMESGSSSAPIDLGKEWPLTELPFTERPYKVRLHGVNNAAEQTVRIAGGEALELQYDRSQDRLIFPPYRRGDARAAIDNVNDRRTSELYRLLPILPRKNLQRVEFEIAIQNQDQLKFTPRPPHVWARIQALDESEKAAGLAEYHFFDAEFAADTPVPVFRFVVSNWPAAATKAAVELWIKFETPPLEPNGASAVAELKPIPIQEDIPQVSFRADLKQVGDDGSWRLTVWEEHDPGSDLFTARVQASPVADQVRHLYFVEVGRVKHEFDYKQKPAPTVYVTSRERITQSAIVMPRVVMAVEE